MKNKYLTGKNCSITLTEDEKKLLHCGMELAIYQNTLNIEEMERAAELGQIDNSIRMRTATLVNSKYKGQKITSEIKDKIRKQVCEEFDI